MVVFTAWRIIRNWLQKIREFFFSKIQKMFCLKPSPDQDWTNKKRIFQIGQSVPKEVGFEHTYKHLSAIYKGYVFYIYFFVITSDIIFPTYELTESTLQCMGRQSLDVLTAMGKNSPRYLIYLKISFYIILKRCIFLVLITFISWQAIFHFLFCRWMKIITKVQKVLHIYIVHR